MMKIFRKVRHDILGKNKTTKYLKYAIGEIVLVVIGILIALTINNWNESKKLDVKRQEYYVQLLNDLKKDKAFSIELIKQIKTDQKKFEAYKNLFLSKKLTPIQVFETIRKLNLASRAVTFNSSTIESLQNSGDIALIPNRLTNQLIDLRRFQEQTKNSADNNDRQKNNVTSRLALLLGSDNFQNRLASNPELKMFINVKENLREIILTFEATQRLKELSEIRTIGQLEVMQKDMEIIIKLIKKEIE